MPKLNKPIKQIVFPSKEVLTHSNERQLFFFVGKYIGDIDWVIVENAEGIEIQRHNTKYIDTIIWDVPSDAPDDKSFDSI